MWGLYQNSHVNKNDTYVNKNVTYVDYTYQYKILRID